MKSSAFAKSEKINKRSKLAALSFLIAFLATNCLGLTAQAQDSGSSGPLLIINPQDNSANSGQNLPQQIIVPKVGPSFGDPGVISNGAFLASTSPYHWLGGYGGYNGVAPIIGATPYYPAATGYSTFGLGQSYAPGGWGRNFGGYSGYGGYGNYSLGGLPGFGGYHGFGGGLGLGFGSVGLGFGGGLGGIGMGFGSGHGGIGMGFGSGLGGLGYGSGLGGIGMGMPFGGYGGYGGYGGFRSFGGYGGYGMGMAGMGMGMAGMGMGGFGGMGGTSPEFGRLTNTRVIQTAPSKASGNYYAPSTPDPTASGSYYSSSGSTSLVFPASHQSGSQSYTKPQRDYWGSGGSPYPKDMNSVPWGK